MAGGHPLLFKTKEELQEKIDAYFADCDPHPAEVTRYEYHKTTITVQRVDPKTRKKKDVEKEVNDLSRPPYAVVEWGVSVQKPYTITGLANFLKTSRRTLVNYGAKEEFFHTIKEAKSRVEEFWENQLLGAHATGPIFNLKNNYGWRDKQEVEHTGDANPLKDVSDKELDERIREHLERQRGTEATS